MRSTAVGPAPRPRRAPARRDRGHPRSAPGTACWSTHPSGDRRVGRRGPRAPGAALQGRRVPGDAGAQRRGDLLRPVVAGVDRVTTWPGRATCCPTHGSARFASALTVDDFLQAPPRDHGCHGEGFDAVGPAAAALADAEGLDCPRRSRSACADGSRNGAGARPPSTGRHEPAPRARRRRAHGRLPLTPDGRGRPPQHQRGPGAAARRGSAELPLPPRVGADRLAPLSGPGRDGPAGPTSRPWRGRRPRAAVSAPRSSPPTAPTRCSRACAWPTGAPAAPRSRFEPTYALHSHIAAVCGTRVVSGERTDDFALDLAEVERVVLGERPTITFLCSPNNPTGGVDPPEAVAAVLEMVESVGRAAGGGRGVRAVRPPQHAGAWWVRTGPWS